MMFTVLVRMAMVRVLVSNMIWGLKVSPKIAESHLHKQTGDEESVRFNQW